MAGADSFGSLPGAPGRAYRCLDGHVPGTLRPRRPVSVETVADPAGEKFGKKVRRAPVFLIDTAGFLF